MTISKLQASLENIQSQLKIEKIYSLAKDTRIKSLEDLVVKLGYDPTNVNATKEGIRSKNEYITTLEK